MGDDQTRRIYDDYGHEWAEVRNPNLVAEATALSHRVSGEPILDLGCGPGWHMDHLAAGGAPIGLDNSATMAAMAAELGHPVCLGDLRALPFRSGAVGGVWAMKSLVHLSRPEVPEALAEIHRVLVPDGAATLVFFAGDAEAVVSGPNDDFPGRTFSYFSEELLADVVVGAGLMIDSLVLDPTRNRLVVRASRAHSLSDRVGPDMSVLVCGLNPSPASAESGIGFHRPGNRFWPAAIDAGLVTADRDPGHALQYHGVGMTDLVKRTTRRADELTAAEYRDGVDRVRRLVAWLGPKLVCFVGLWGWRAAVDAKATAGLQPEPFGGHRAYVMPSTSGLNAHETRASLADHFRTVRELARRV